MPSSNTAQTSEALMPSLDQLNDILMPPDPDYWPIGELGMFVLGLLVYLCLLTLLKAYLHWRRQAYRRAGLVLVDEAKNPYELSVALKRVCLAVYPREEVAGLYGQTWTAFLNQQCPQVSFPEDCNWQYRGEVSQLLRRTASQWVRYHSVKSSVTWQRTTAESE